MRASFSAERPSPTRPIATEHVAAVCGGEQIALTVVTRLGDLDLGVQTLQCTSQVTPLPQQNGAVAHARGKPDLVTNPAADLFLFVKQHGRRVEVATAHHHQRSIAERALPAGVIAERRHTSAMLPKIASALAWRPVL